MAEPQGRKSAFGDQGFEATVAALMDEVVTMYRADGIPWVVGYSGGKDSSAVLQLIWLALESLAPEERTKLVYVITTDTLVENPIVAAWVNNSLEKMDDAAKLAGLPLTAHRSSHETLFFSRRLLLRSAHDA